MGAVIARAASAPRLSVAVIAPEPAPWLAPLLARLPGEVQVLAPWAVPALLAQGAPRRLRAALQRRVVTAGAAALTWVPGWALLEGGLRLWARAHLGREGRFGSASVSRVMSARFALRAAVDHAAARWLPQAEAVYAPSGAAQRSFAVARARGARAVLVQDLPLLRRLHEDLDRAAAQHPGCAFLRRYRASHAALQRQEAEHALAHEILARGRFALDVLQERGLPARLLAELDEGSDHRGPAAVIASDERGAATGVVSEGAAPRPPGPARVLLAGLAAARNGSQEALAALALRPDLELLIRPGEGMEPGDLLTRPRVRAASAEERGQLRGVALVLAPAWCESYPEEVPRALRAGVPVIATRQAAGAGAVSAEIPPGAVAALVAALARLLPREP